LSKKNWTSKIVVDIECLKKDMILFQYEAPTGEKKHTRLWNGGNGVGTLKLYHHGKLLDELEAKNIGCEYGEFNATKPYQNKIKKLKIKKK